jgi:hypothetical protein
MPDSITQIKNQLGNKQPSYRNKSMAFFFYKYANLSELSHSYPLCVVFQIHVAIGTDELLMAIGQADVSRPAHLHRTQSPSNLKVIFNITNNY